jgi:hypothetical protein
MKYILFAEAPPARGKLGTGREDREKKIEMRKDEEKYGKVILEPHFYSTGKLILVVDFDNPRQMANRMALGAPELIYKAYPLIPGEDWGAAMDEHHWKK